MTRATISSGLAGFLLGVVVAVLGWTVFENTVGSKPRYEAASTQTTADAVLETIRHRRTVRSYQATPIPREDLMKILEAAHLAPTAGNQQPWKFLVLQDRAKLDLLRERALDWYMDGVATRPEVRGRDLDSLRIGVASMLEDALSAPVYVAVVVDTEARYPDYVIYDGTLAAGNLMIAARAMGYGTGFFTTFFPEQRMKEFLGIPERYSLICFTPIGVPEEWPRMPSKKDVNEVTVFGSFEP